MVVTHSHITTSPDDRGSGRRHLPPQPPGQGRRALGRDPGRAADVSERQHDVLSARRSGVSESVGARRGRRAPRRVSRATCARCSLCVAVIRHDVSDSRRRGRRWRHRRADRRVHAARTGARRGPGRPRARRAAAQHRADRRRPRLPGGRRRATSCARCSRSRRPTTAPTFGWPSSRASSPRDDGWRLQTSDGEVQARAVILATGARLRSLGVEGEERLQGRGVSHCASCDAPLMRDRTSASWAAATPRCRRRSRWPNAVGEVIVLHRGDALTAQAAYREPRARSTRRSASATAPWSRRSSARTPSAACASATRRRATRSDLELGGLFIYVGLAPNSEYLRDVLELDEDGRIPTDAAHADRARRRASRRESCAAARWAGGHLRRRGRGGGQGGAPPPRRRRLAHERGEQESTPAAAGARGNGGSHG